MFIYRFGFVGRVEWVVHWLGRTHTNEYGLVTASNSDQPCSAILLRTLTSIMTSVI